MTEQEATGGAVGQEAVQEEQQLPHIVLVFEGEHSTKFNVEMYKVDGAMIGAAARLLDQYANAQASMTVAALMQRAQASKIAVPGKPG